jgi:hypothetical protein
VNTETTRKITTAVIICAFLILAAVGGWRTYEYFTLQHPLEEIIENNPEMKEIRAEIRYKNFFDKKDLIFNLTHVPDPKVITPFILFAELAKEIHYREYRQVYIQYKGKTKFMLDGNDFSNIGIKTQLASVDEICVDFPPLLKRTDGMKLYNEPYGDVQWVTQKKIRNFQDFIYNWYLNDWIANLSGKERRKTDVQKRPVKNKDKEKDKKEELFDGLIPEIEITETPFYEEQSEQTHKTNKRDIYSPDYIPMIEPE